MEENSSVDISILYQCSEEEKMTMTMTITLTLYQLEQRQGEVTTLYQVEHTGQ